MKSTIGEKAVNVQGLPYMPPNLVNFGPETVENGWQVFCPPPKLSHWETLSALPRGRYVTDSSKLRHVLCTVVARAYSLEQQNADRAQAWLCHAFSYDLFAQKPKSALACYFVTKLNEFTKLHTVAYTVKVHVISLN